MNNKSFNIYLLLSIVLLSSFSKDQSPDAYYKNGLQHYNNKEYLRAIGDFTYAISLKTDYADAYFYRAKSKWLFGEEKGFYNPDLCQDYIEAMKFGNGSAIEALNEADKSRCYTLESAMHEPNIAFCVDLSSKLLKEVPEEAESLMMLSSLDLWNNKISDIEDLTSQYSFLVYLNLGSNKVEKIPASITKLKYLYDLNLSKNGLEEIPDEIRELNHLTYLNLRNNDLTEIPQGMTQLSSLKMLDLTLNYVEKFPKDLSGLKNLELLILTGNPMNKKEVNRIAKALPQTNVVFNN